LVGLVVGGVVALASPVVGVGILVVLAVVVPVWTWKTAPSRLLHSIGARPRAMDEQPRLQNLVDGLCATMGLPTPTVMVVDHPLPNALAVGNHPRSAVLVVTSNLDTSLSLVELEGVLAHELVHIKRHDTVCSGMAVAVVAWLGPFSGSGPALVHRLVGPGREFAADLRAVSIVRYWAGLQSALEVLAVPPPAFLPPWPPGPGRRARLTGRLWINPDPTGSAASTEGDVDDIGVRTAALALY
jgi:heat shock protein HtpX